MMRGMNNPSTRYRSWKNALVSMSTVVTSEAMMSTKTTMRILGTRDPRISETTELVAISTSVVAIPRASPLTSVVVMASSGQSPSNCTNAALLRQNPSMNRFPALFMEETLLLVQIPSQYAR